ncbi:hypothetical protein RN001_009780 [Aquatica leii]|uniref:V(D)J recombination-activating protein 1 RNase H domain-containing protein n=1 Tax=Aquatica leii TaxID=1421715 RepID=A0AAN7SFT0_9COLE|nr:hypothetical protein RN001_009780 [Aquatica leii]
MICKWGCDGSQQSQYKQKFDNEVDSDANIFQICFVPVRLVCRKNNEKVLWECPTPSSPRWCRPIRFCFVKETTNITNDEINYVKKHINTLIATEVDIHGKKFFIKHKFIMTMVDGKVCNAVTGTTSTSRCYICGATSKEFNKLDHKRDISFEATEFCRRFFENPKLASKITGISYDLIFRLKVILETISSGYSIDVQKYEDYALATARLYVELYPWHPMTPTLHKVLIHGAVIIKNALLPIGQLSEERIKKKKDVDTTA